MKNLLILYNVVFFFVGNILLSNIHHLSHHDHNHDLVENQECYECINFDNSKDCITYNNEINFWETKVEKIMATSFSLNITQTKATTIGNKY